LLDNSAAKSSAKSSVGALKRGKLKKERQNQRRPKTQKNRSNCECDATFSKQTKFASKEHKKKQSERGIHRVVENKQEEKNQQSKTK
jgi:hypothetical protein